MSRSKVIPFEIKPDLRVAMLTIYRRAKSEAKYAASIFYNMLSDKGGLATPKNLINSLEGMVEDKRWAFAFYGRRVG